MIKPKTEEEMEWNDFHFNHTYMFVNCIHVREKHDCTTGFGGDDLWYNLFSQLLQICWGIGYSTGQAAATDLVGCSLNPLTGSVAVLNFSVDWERLWHIMPGQHCTKPSSGPKSAMSTIPCILATNQQVAGYCMVVLCCWVLKRKAVKAVHWELKMKVVC